MRKALPILVIFYIFLCPRLLHAQAKYIYQWQMGSEALGIARFLNSSYIALDGQGNIYVNHPDNHSILKLDSRGKLLYKIGTRGSADGQFNFPQGIVVDHLDNVYVIDVVNNRIQKFNKDGAFVNKFDIYGVSVIAIDGQDNLYIYDSSKACIQKFTSDGQLLFKFGTQGSGDRQFQSVQDMTIDKQGNLYVVDSGNYRIQKFDSQGNFLSKFGRSGSNDGQFNSPWGIAVDSQGNIYVSDIHYLDNHIQKFNSSGQFLSKFGTPGSGDGQFQYPLDIDTDEKDNLYVVDRDNFRICKFDTNESLLSKFGSDGLADGEFYNPTNIAIDGQANFYVVDEKNHRIQKFTSDGQFLFKFGTYGSGDGQFNNPRDVSVDKQGNLYVLDIWNHRIQKFDSNGQFLYKFSTRGHYPNNTFEYATAIAVDNQGNIYVSYDDSSYPRIRKFNNQGQFLSWFGTSGSGNGQFFAPVDICIDKQDNIYVVETGNARIQKFDSNGQFLLMFGSYGSAPGQFSLPYAAAVDNKGNLYVADQANSRIQKFNSQGMFLVSIGSMGTADGQFNNPTGVAVDEQENIYISDTHNHRIQKYGFVSGPEITIKVKRTTIPDNTSFDFGTTTLGMPLLTSFTIDNTGGAAALLVSNLNLPSNFILSGNFPSSIAAGASAIFEVQLPATAAGNYNGMLSFTTNDADENPYNFIISGTVEKVDQRIDFADLPDKTFGELPFTLKGSATSGLPLTFIVLSGPASLSGDTLSLTGAGLVTIQISQAGDSNYNPIYIEKSFTVHKASQTIYFNDLPDKILGDLPFVLQASATSGLPVTFTLVKGPATLAGQTLTIIGLRIIHKFKYKNRVTRAIFS